MGTLTDPAKARDKNRSVPRIVHAADLHIDSPMRGLVRDAQTPAHVAHTLTTATRRAFSNLVDACVQSKADLLVLAGDLFDGNWNDNGTGAFFVAEVARLAESGTRVVFARGNHDATSEITRGLRLPTGAFELGTSAVDERRFEDLGIRVVGRGFPERAVRDDYVRQFPTRDGNDFHLGVLHTNVGGNVGHGNYAPSDITSLQALGYDYMALGHVHEHAVLSSAPWVVYPGNLQGRHIKETGAKGAVRFDIEHGRVAHVERLLVDVLRWQRLEISLGDELSLDDVHARVEHRMQEAMLLAEGRPMACRLHLTGATRLHDKLVAHTDALTEEGRASALRLSGAGCWVQSVHIATRRPASLHASTALESDIDRLLARPEYKQGLGETFASLRRTLPNEALRAHLDMLLEGAAEEGAQLLRALLAGESLS